MKTTIVVIANRVFHKHELFDSARLAFGNTVIAQTADFIFIMSTNKINLKTFKDWKDFNKIDGDIAEMFWRAGSE